MAGKMKTSRWITLALTVLLTAGLVASCGTDNAKIEEVVTGPMTYVGSEQCKVCHLEHYDSWKMTLHSRTLQEVTQNRDALITDIDPEVIRASLKNLEKNLKVPVDQIYIPKVEEIKYTIGIQWNQRFLIERQGKLYIAPIQYDAWENSWSAYHEHDWDKHSWNMRCGGCHVTGLDLEKNTFTEAAVGCEACHGPGSHHVALPKKAVFDKRLTIVNPSKFPAGIRTQICGSCHSAGKSTKVKDAYWPVGHKAGQALGPYFTPVSFADRTVKSVYGDEVPDRHHQQYQNWQQSIHAQQGVSCTSCHYVHQLGVSPTQFQTKESGSQQCLSCHTMIKNKYAHSIHAFANCVGCHMPRVDGSIETGAVLSHTFRFLSPVETLKAGGYEKHNACSSCHHHKETSVEALAGFLEAAIKNDMPKPFAVHLRPGQSGK
jgi:predicted CXXCH cytochrome family protein